VIEQAFGMLKGRWHCLLVKLDESVDKVPLPFIACCILHNICIDILDDVDVDPEHDEPDELLPLLGHENSEGSRLRNKIKEAFFSNVCICNEPFCQHSAPLTMTLENQT